MRTRKTSSRSPRGIRRTVLPAATGPRDDLLYRRSFVRQGPNQPPPRATAGHSRLRRPATRSRSRDEPPSRASTVAARRSGGIDALESLQIADTAAVATPAASPAPAPSRSAGAGRASCRGGRRPPGQDHGRWSVAAPPPDPERDTDAPAEGERRVTGYRGRGPAARACRSLGKPIRIPYVRRRKTICQANRPHRDRAARPVGHRPERC